MIVDQVSSSIRAQIPANDVKKQSGSGFQAYVNEVVTAQGDPSKNAERGLEVKSLRDQILELGFTEWVAEMQKEKFEEEVRQKILDALGVTEEEFLNMPADQRAQIEQAVQEEIKRILVERGQEKMEEEGNKGQVSIPVFPGAIG